MPKVVLNRLLCNNPQEDKGEGGGANGDEVFLTFQPDGSKERIDADQNNGLKPKVQVYPYMDEEFNFETHGTIRLWENDAEPNPDEFLGSVKVASNSLGTFDAVFVNDDAYYVLNYTVA